MKEYRDHEKERIRLSREAKKSDSVYVPAEAKLVFVVRIKGINKIDPKKRKTLQLLRLLQINRRCLHQAHQGDHGDAQDCGAVCCVRIPEPKIGPRTHLQ